MFKFKIKEIYKILLFTLVLLWGCFDPPDDFVAPTWDTEVNLPIVEKEYSLSEIVEKDSSLLKASQDPETLGLIYFGDTQEINSISIKDELSIDPFSTNFSQKIGTLHINVPLPAASNIRVEDWTTDVTTGSTQVFPEQEGDVEIEVVGIETVESIFAESGELSILMWNNLPVEIVLRGVKIENSNDATSIIAEIKGTQPSNWITIPPFEVDTLKFPIVNKYITNSLKYIGTIWSEGSNGQEVVIAEDAGTTILALFDNLVVSEAVAQLPPQEFNLSNNIILDDSTKIEEAVISSGSAFMTANNNMDVDLIANLAFENLYTLSGERYAVEIPLARNEKNKVIQIGSLSDWLIKTTTPGTPVNYLSYTLEVVTDSTGELSTIAKDDSLTFNVNFEGLVFKSFEGMIKPTIINLDESGFKLDYGNFKDQFQFSEVNFKDALFKLNMISTMDMNLLLFGDLVASNGNYTKYKSIDDILLPSSEPIEIDITDLINGFSSELPDSFSLNGKGLLNPYYQTSKIENGDSIYGSIDFEIPLNVGISQGIYKDTIEVEANDIEDAENLNYGEVTFSIVNSIPVGLIVSASVLDSNYVKVLDLPTPYNEIENLEIPKPEVSQSGDILVPSEFTQTVTLFDEDISKLLNNPYILIEVEIGTAGDENLPVKFKTSNSIVLDVKAKAEYRVDLN